MSPLECMRGVLNAVNDTRRSRDALLDRMCVLRSGLTIEGVRALRAAGLTRTEIMSQPVSLMPDESDELVEIGRELQRLEAHLAALDLSARRLGVLVAEQNESEQTRTAPAPTTARQATAKILAFVGRRPAATPVAEPAAGGAVGA